MATIAHSRPRVSRFAVLVTALVIAATACGSSGAKSAAPASSAPGDTVAPYAVRVGFISPKSFNYTPMGYSIDRGGEVESILAAAGATDVTFVPFGTGPNVNDAFRSGDIDVAIETDTPSVVAKAGGIDTRVLSAIVLHQNASLLAKKDGPTSVAALAGTTVGVAKGTYADRYLRGVLAQAGIADQVNISNVNIPDAEAALTGGSIAAYAAPVPTNVLLASKGFPVLDQAKDHPDLTGALYSVASQKFIDAHPGFVEAWEQARVQARREALASYDDYVKFQAEGNGLTLAVQQQAANPPENYPEDAFTDEANQQLTNTVAFLTDQGLIKASVDVGAWYQPASS